MFSGWKTLVVVLFFSYFVFSFGKPIWLQFIDREDFSRRRIVWVSLTFACFLSPNFWVYTAVAIPLFIWCAGRDSQPASIYFLMYCAIPPVGVEIPIVGVNKLFAMSEGRLLSLTVLLPMAWRLFKSSDRSVNKKFTLMDALVLGYFALDLILFIPYEAPTNTLRRAVISFLDSILVYFVFSRLALSRKSIVDAIATFCLMCAILAPLAFFEWAKSWPLYGEIAGRWGVPVDLAFLMRGDSLRALVSTGHSLTLGSFMAIGFCFSLFLQSQIAKKAPGLLLVGWMWLGLYAALSRAPWITAILMLFLFLLLSPGGVSRFIKGFLVAGLVSGVILMTPIGERVIDFLPFVGTVDQGNVTYRQELARVSWILIQENPLFGDPFAMRNMESLRQGQGIIDLVNAYADVALFHGLVGLTLFCGVFLSGLYRAGVAVRKARLIDRELAMMGASLIACMLAMLFFIGTAGFISFLYPLAGLLASYSNLVALSKKTPEPQRMTQPLSGQFSRPLKGRLHPG